MAELVKAMCDMCGFSEFAKVVLIKVDTESNDVYLEVVCPKCGHKGTLSFVSLVRSALSGKDTA